MSFDLPESAVEFLREGGQLAYDESKCEAGRVGLKQLEQLVLSEVHVDIEELEDDPHAGEFGYYAIPAVSLSGACDSYNPEFILLWLPEERLFGAWDCDHLALTVFPEATWEKIVADPALYLNAQWYPDNGAGVAFRPSAARHEFRLHE